MPSTRATVSSLAMPSTRATVDALAMPSTRSTVDALPVRSKIRDRALSLRFSRFSRAFS